MGTVRFPNRGNGWWIFSRTALVESRIHSTSSLVFQDERSEQKQGAGVTRILILLAGLVLVGERVSRNHVIGAVTNLHRCRRRYEKTS